MSLRVARLLRDARRQRLARIARKAAYCVFHARCVKRRTRHTAVIP
jgi:hypothetical protein